MTVFGGKLYARLGDCRTNCPRERRPSGGSSYLVCIDLEAQGRLMWKIAPEEAGWAFEGSPLVDAKGVYVAMRRSDIRPGAYVGCFDVQTGERRWRRFVCSAETPSRGTLCEITHNLLSLRRDTLFYNTNLGAVAALATQDGAIRWLTLYPRARHGSLSRPAAFRSRDLTPCVVHGGTVVVAPSDSPRIFGLDAATGQILWQTGTQVEDVVHLLGVADDRLIASGERLYWISLRLEDAGRIQHAWPDGPARPGFGRGVLAGDRVYWPGRDRIFVFDQATARLLKTIDLRPHGLEGGNLLADHGRLMVATGSALIGLGRDALEKAPSPLPLGEGPGVRAFHARKDISVSIEGNFTNGAASPPPLSKGEGLTLLHQL